jgi:hypothetical protein
MKKLLLTSLVVLCTGCSALVPNHEKTHWDIDGNSTYGDEWWVQGMEIEMEIAIRRVDIESNL